MGRISPGPTRWPPGAERRLVPAKSNLKPQTYRCAAFVFGSGWRLGVGFVNPASPCWGLGWVCLGTVCGVVPLVSAVCGVRGWASVLACFWDVCGFVGAPLAPRRFRFRRAVWACVLGPGLGCAQPFLAGLSGCVFCAFVFSFFFLCPGTCGPRPSIPFLSGWAGGSPFFFFVSASLFPVGRCYWLGVAGFGWVVPLCLCGGPVFGAFWGGVWSPLVVLAGGLADVGCFGAFSPSPPLCFSFFWGGGLPVPPSAFPGLARALACIQGCLPGCFFQLRSVWSRSGPMGRVGYVHGGLGAPSCWVRSWLCRLGGCARRLLVVLG